MKAAVYTRYGAPEVVQVKNIEKPIPKDNELLIKVHASTVNRTDCGFRSAQYFVSRFFSGLFNPKQQVLGCEFAGLVEETGKSVDLFKAGDRIFGFNDSKFGGHAEYMVLSEEDAIAHIPNGFSYEEAAPLAEGAHYALCNIRAAKVEPGHKVLVNGGTGAIGSAAIQLLKFFKADVTAVCRTEHMKLVASLGADEVWDYTIGDFTLNASERFDFVFDAVGKSSFGKCKRLLKSNGIYISTELGYMSQNIFLALITPLARGKRLLFPLPTINKADVIFLKDLAEKGKYKPLIDRSYQLDEIVHAHRYAESGQKVGNVVLNIQS